MKVIVQRVKQAQCIINGKIFSSIDAGMVVLVGFTHNDTYKEVDKMIKKIINLRIFNDENGKMNLNISQINGSILSISQFTLYANPYTGNRPSFTDALNPELASKLYDYFNSELKKNLLVKSGIFGADMQISLINDGPVTIEIEYI